MFSMDEYVPGVAWGGIDYAYNGIVKHKISRKMEGA